LIRAISRFSNDLKISDRGLILIAVPLIFELIFVVTLAYLLQQAETEAINEAHSRAVIEHSDAVTRSMVDALTAAGAYRVTMNQFFRDRFMTAAGRLTNEFNILDRLLQGNSKQLANLAKLKVISDRGLKMLMELQTSEDEVAPLQKLLGTPVRFNRVQSLVSQLTQASNHLIEAEKPIASESLAARQATRERIMQVIYGGIILNILVAILLARFFSRGISVRVRTIMDNTQRLAVGRSLNPPLEGSDEFGELDRVFHRMTDQLNQSEKVKQHLLAAVSHDIGTPIMSVQGVISLLQAGAWGKLSDEAAIKLAGAEEQISRVMRLSRDLGDVELIAAGKIDLQLQPLAVSDVFAAAISTVSVRAEQVKVFLSAEKTDARVLADHDRLVQILVNLLVNAIKFSPKGAVVSLSAVSNRHNIQLEVTDQGRGVPIEYQKQIFERFVQVQESDRTEKGGSGLGLSICKMLVESHGGKIGVKSEEGKGSTFWFTLQNAGDKKE